jgi:WD40 repeat protein
LFSLSLKIPWAKNTYNFTQIITCSWQKMHPMQLWDYGSGKLIASLEPDAFNSVVSILTNLSYYVSQIYVRVCTYPKTLRCLQNNKKIWNFETSHNNALILKQLYSGKWVSKEVIAAGGAEPNIIRFVNQRTMMVSTIPTCILSV